MADFVSNFLDGLKERRRREDLQAARAEQTRQFEATRAAQMFEFNANRARQQQALDLQRQQEQRLQEREDRQELIQALDLQATGKAAQLDATSEFEDQQGFELGGQRLRLTTPEEQAKRKFQLDVGMAKNRISEMSKFMAEVAGPEGAAEVDRLFKDPRVLMETVFDVKAGRQATMPSSINAAVTQLEMEKLNEPGSWSQAKETTLKEFKRLMSQQSTSEVQRILGAMGGLAPQESIQQQDATAADVIREFAPALAGLTIDEIIKNKEDAIKLLRGGLIDAIQQGQGPFSSDAAVRLNPETIMQRIPSISRRIIEDIIQGNKKTETKKNVLETMRDGQPTGSNLTPEQRRSLGMQ